MALIGGFLAWLGYTYVVQDNVVDTPDASHELYIGANWTYDSLLFGLDSVLINKSSFDRVAKEMNLPNKIRPGKYQIASDLGNRDLINTLTIWSNQRCQSHIDRKYITQSDFF